MQTISLTIWSRSFGLRGRNTSCLRPVMTVQLFWTQSVYYRVFLGHPEPPFRTGLCFTRDVSFFRHAFSEIPWPIALKFCHMIGIWPYFINWLQKFRGCSPQKKLGAKTCKISVNFGPLQTLLANISGTRQHIQNRKDVRTTEIPPAFDEKSPVYIRQ